MFSTVYTRSSRIIRDRATRLTPWLDRVWGRRGFFIFLAALTGGMAGYCAYLLKYMIGHVSEWLTSGMGEDPYYILIALPVAGVLLAGMFTRYVLKMDIEDGCGKIEADMKSGRYRLRPRLIPGNMIAATFTLGFGGSAGSEGPIAYTGAALGSNLGRMFSLSDRQLKLLVGIGSGAAIAGIFKAPVGGMMFTIEVLAMPMSVISLIALAVACLIAGAVASACSGYTLDVAYHAPTPFGPDMILPIIALGVFCGLYSLWYSGTNAGILRFILKLRNPWVRNTVTGLAIGGLLFLFPRLYGEGYLTVAALINGDFKGLLDHTLWRGGSFDTALWMIAGILLVKGAIVQLTNRGGGVGGDFAPTLFAGALCGFLFAALCNNILGTSLSLADFSFFGMSAVMAGTIQAPLMALFLTTEMTGDMAMLLPLMIAAAISYAMVRTARRLSRIPLRL